MISLFRLKPEEERCRPGGLGDGIEVSAMRGDADGDDACFFRITLLMDADTSSPHS